MRPRALLLAALGALALTFAGCAAEIDDLGTAEDGLRVDCSYVRCALPLCAEGQHLIQPRNTCCPRCVGAPSRCATVLCAAVECAEGEQRVHRGPNDCCGTCEPIRPVAECRTDADCPQIVCVTTPCPTNHCVGGQCMQTLDAEY